MHAARQTIKHSEGQTLTQEDSTKPFHVIQAGINAALAKLKLEPLPKAMDQMPDTFNGVSAQASDRAIPQCTIKELINAFESTWNLQPGIRGHIMAAMAYPETIGLKSMLLVERPVALLVVQTDKAFGTNPHSVQTKYVQI